MSENSRSSGGHGGTAASVAGGIVLIYFGFPALWYWPIWKFLGGGASTSITPPEWVLYFLLPIGWLGEVFPAYGEWVEWGGKALGMT